MKKILMFCCGVVCMNNIAAMTAEPKKEETAVTKSTISDDDKMYMGMILELGKTMASLSDKFIDKIAQEEPSIDVKGFTQLRITAEKASAEFQKAKKDILLYLDNITYPGFKEKALGLPEKITTEYEFEPGTASVSQMAQAWHEINRRIVEALDLFIKECCGS